MLGWEGEEVTCMAHPHLYQHLALGLISWTPKKSVRAGDETVCVGGRARTCVCVCVCVCVCMCVVMLKLMIAIHEKQIDHKLVELRMKGL